MKKSKKVVVYVDGKILDESLYSLTDTGFDLVAPLNQLFPNKKADESGEYFFDIQIVYGNYIC